MIAEILCVGTELLMGQVLNTNAQFISRRLSALGIAQYHQVVVGDNPDRLREAYRQALSRADVVITSGGLGPTCDDITKRIAAEAVGKELVFRPEAWADVVARFAAMKRPITENNRAQAYFTADTELIVNHKGTAPGAIVPAGGDKVIIHLPGPPFELEPMFDETVYPWLEKRSGQTFVSRYIRIFGMGESVVDEKLADLMAGANPTLSPYCSIGEVQLRLTARAESEEAGLALLTPVLEEVRRRLGDVIYAVEADSDGSLARTAVNALLAKGKTVATAESLTGGMIAAAMVEVPGASGAVRGGFVTYQTDTKTVLLDVPAEVIERYDVVSAEVARGMAEGARRKLGTDYAVSATGLAGPGGGTPERPVGTVFVGIAGEGFTDVLALRLTGDRAKIRALTVKYALHGLIRRVGQEQ